MEPTQKQIDDLLAKIDSLINSGKNPYFGMSYLDGLRDAIDFMTGDGDDPLIDE